MKCTILHECKGRIRVHTNKESLSFDEADKLEYYLLSFDDVWQVKIYERTGDAAIFYTGKRSEIIRILSAFSFKSAKAPEIPSQRALRAEYEERIVSLCAIHFAKKLFLPVSVTNIITAFKAVKYLAQGLRSLLQGRLDVAVLDGASITVSVLTGDFSTAASVMFLLSLGDTLEEWTHKKSLTDLARTMSLNVENVWLKTEDGDVLVSADEIRPGDRIVVRTGGMIPLDGRVYEGEILVNQSSMTGEPLPVRKSPGSGVFAGCAVEEGEAVIIAEKPCGAGRYDRIVKMIEETESLKSNAENRSGQMADRLVPATLAGTLATWLLTGNAQRAISVLMVDFSCALKLAVPIAMLYGINEAGRNKITVKGAKFMEKIALADTIVFDKTGTLTIAQPQVKEIITFGGADETRALRIAACMEEHYPHSMANAVVEEAKRRGISHDEMHSEINYIVAHGISCEIAHEKAVIGSWHFVFEDEGCMIPEGEEEKFRNLPEHYSHLYMAISGKLICVICIEDPVKPGAKGVIRKLKGLGINKAVMMTGDSYKTAKAVAKELSLDEFHAGVLPEQKAGFIEKLRGEGRKVIMVGDGINDSLALSKADAGVAISSGAAIAREIADITITSDDLESLVLLKELSLKLTKRVNSDYRAIISFNLALILLGAFGVLPSSVSALLHNASTILISLCSTTPLLPDKNDR